MTMRPVCEGWTTSCLLEVGGSGGRGDFLEIRNDAQKKKSARTTHTDRKEGKGKMCLVAIRSMKPLKQLGCAHVSLHKLVCACR